MKVVLASGNQGKIKELSALLLPLNINIITQTSLGITDVAETGLSFVENALLKARHACKISKLPAIADDSGLVVPYLQGAPGIYSARYAGENKDSAANNAKLLATLSNVAEKKRAAYFYCVIAMLRHEHDPIPIIACGQWHGEIAVAPQGANGFGYDPIFYLPQFGLTAAQLAEDKKNLLSHRALAIQSLLAQLTSMNELHA